MIFVKGYLDYYNSFDDFFFMYEYLKIYTYFLIKCLLTITINGDKIKGNTINRKIYIVEVFMFYLYFFIKVTKYTLHFIEKNSEKMGQINKRIIIYKVQEFFILTKFFIY